MKLRFKPTWFIKPGDEHLAQFYAERSVLADDLLTYVLTGLEQGDTCLIIATPEVLIRLQKGLRTNHIDVASALSSGQYIIRDAEEMIGKITQDKQIDLELFKSEVGVLLDFCSQRQRPVRVFGEMAAVLTYLEQAKTITQLEECWHELMHDNPCSLYCAYPRESLERITAAHFVDAIKSCHDMVATGTVAHSL